MQEVLTEKLGGTKYNVDTANKLAKEITEVVKAKLKGTLGRAAVSTGT